MNRTPRVILAAATVGLLTLATACGDKGSSNPKYIATTTVGPDATATDGSTVAGGTDANGSVTTVQGSGGSGSSANVVDPQLEQAITDAETLLSQSDQDLKDAQSAQANGG